MPFAGGLIEHECPRCHRAVELPFGELCRSCRDQIDRKARQLGRNVSLVTTILLSAYIYFFRHPADQLQRQMSVVALVIWFIVSNIVVRRAVKEMSK